ncbi:ornithine cyclodeaminase [Candidatus Gracilibacteria bacterium]|nr:ornithine cyclodeaminase [Candidatus Gracilibacteria bacterium]
MKIITIASMKKIVSDVGIAELIEKIENRLRKDYLDWESFEHSVRYAHYVKEGAIELMPVGNKDYFSYKYVNGHPQNVKIGHPSVMGIGQLSECRSGEPILLSEMTILTALRTAATTAFTASFFPCESASHFAIIGNGTQSIFQTIAICERYNIKEISHYDIDLDSMALYKQQIQKIYPNILIKSTKSSRKAVKNAEIIITVTEAFGKQQVIKEDDIKIGACIFAIGGDCPNKTELDIEILKNSAIVVEYEQQTRKEGELQNFPKGVVFANLNELVTGKKTLKDYTSKYYLFDGVGIGIEDYSALQVIYDISKQDGYGEEINLIPKNMKNLKNLYGYIFD